ncbi:TatD family hydrolase [Bacteroidota bacterium]|nr:TatD family hydrolase [Bacteroidota bacterium]
MIIVDTHTHIYLEDFNSDIDETIQRAENIGVKYFMLPNIDSVSIAQVKTMHQKFPESCLPMMGLHPCSVKEIFQSELKIVEEELFNNASVKYYGVGECGLDYYWDKTFIQQQKEALHIQSKWAKDLNLPIILHTRDSMDDGIELIKEEQNGKLKGIFHCFGGTIEQAQQIIDLGFLLGIGGVLTYKKSGMDVVLKNIDLKYLVMETDAPYLTPVPFRGKRNEPAYLEYILSRLSEVKNCSKEEVARITTENAINLFGLKN